jgi:hypothetical protein
MMEFYFKSYENNTAVFKDLFFGLTENEYRWREGEDKWNILEIVCHLYDEEREDFRKRLQSVLDDPQKSFEKIDPAGWVKLRGYDEQDFETVTGNFLHERLISINWLRSLKEPQWTNTYVHPQVGPMSAKFILTNWVAHDYLHIRQITRIKYNNLKSISGQSLDSAGNWYLINYEVDRLNNCRPV